MVDLCVSTDINGNILKNMKSKEIYIGYIEKDIVVNTDIEERKYR